ncbi:ribonuclease H [Candidatus Peregrinibacteria bacterium CG_4_10_14_0_2_um_filter_43_11]|nr:MAG: ribonuclease H [Candidatus Peregrinibacteria bacterium CG_4_10_14_0_2_um_filter_43_11]
MKIDPRHLKEIEKLIPERERQAFVNNAIDQAIFLHKASHTKTIEIYVDGGSRGNPGKAGGGFVIFKAGKEMTRGKEYFGEKTNNQAEYLALRLALREAYDRFADSTIKCFMDSQLVVEQMKGNYKVKSENIKALHNEVCRIADQFKSFNIMHIHREQNKRADQLANEAMDEA